VALEVGAVGLDQVDALLHLGHGLQADLAGLGRDDPGELDAALGDQRGDPAQRGGALGERRGRPLGLRGSRGAHGRGHHLGGRRVRARDDARRIARVGALEDLADGATLAGDQVGERRGPALARFRERLLEGVIQGRISASRDVVERCHGDGREFARPLDRKRGVSCLSSFARRQTG
jgi:hypothetical protein